MAVFSDGKVAEQEIKLNVTPSAKGLKKFCLNQGFPVVAVSLGFPTEHPGTAWLMPEVYFDQLDYPIHIQDSSLLDLTAEQPEDHPVIRVDPNGLIQGLRPGRAKISGNFDGIRDSVIVIVHAKGTSPVGIR